MMLSMGVYLLHSKEYMVTFYLVKLNFTCQSMSRELNIATKYRVWEYKVIVFICLHSSSKLGRVFKSGVSKVKGPSEILNYQYFDHVIKNI